MKGIRLLNKVKYISRLFYPRYCTLNSNIKVCSMHTPGTIVRSSYFAQYKFISNCSSMQTIDTDSPNDKDRSEQVKKVLEDDEFQSILKDFASDFGVDKDTNDLLNDIRKNINGNYKHNASEKSNEDVSPKSVVGGGLGHKYKRFSDADCTTIPSYEDKSDPEDDGHMFHIDQDLKPKLYDDITRGVTGVFDIDDMIQVLRNESLLDIAAISMLTDSKDSSCDFFVLATARSERHIEAAAESILKLYKKKKNKTDPFLTPEGTTTSGWRVIDMGNIVLHIFLEQIRSKYDIESCQLLDLEYDSGGNVERDPMLHIIEEQMEFFNSLNKSEPSAASKDSN